MGVKITGLDQLQAKLQRMAQAAQAVDGPQEVQLGELFPPEFIRACSRFGSVGEFLTATGFRIQSADDLKAIPDEQWDSFVRANTSYGSWKEMVGAAKANWAKKRLGL